MYLGTTAERMIDVDFSSKHSNIIILTYKILIPGQDFTIEVR